MGVIGPGSRRGQTAVEVPMQAVLEGHYREDAPYPSVIVNVTERCNLSCAHCFIYRDANPLSPVRPRVADEPMKIPHSPFWKRGSADCPRPL